LDRSVRLCPRRHRPEAPGPGSQILQILSVTLFEKTPILRALQASGSDDDFLFSGNQLNLFDF
jgi:hypothetical protein